jgi:thiol-disulfide isomerase/thioredoxin
MGALLMVLSLLVGCSSGSGAPVGPPGPAPENVTFVEPPAEAPRAPSFELELLNGERVDSQAHWAERPMVLVFFESWCELCMEQQPEINELVADYEDVVLFLGIAELSSEDDLLEYVRDNDVAYPVAVDSSGDIWFRYAATEPPVVVLISKGGRVLRGWPGGISGEMLRGQIEELAIESLG